MFQVGLKGSVGVSFVLASAKMAKVPTVVKTTKIQRNMRSTTMATYCQSSLSCARMDEKKQSSDKEAKRAHIRNQTYGKEQKWLKRKRWRRTTTKSDR